ncbi:hypothetical protein [Azovibrio restrictus]|uniref:hypothetical protein n=1 Tax=Azovibrio restrictus TaxID=146938 RepID=UPI0026F2867C|nr:hypothetical protein [Azovibrio restrictus]
MTTRRYPLSFLILTALGLATGLPGLLSVAGFGAPLHPLLEDPMAGLALVVSAVALIGSGLFPFFIARLTRAGETPGPER